VIQQIAKFKSRKPDIQRTQHSPRLWYSEIAFEQPVCIEAEISNAIARRDALGHQPGGQTFAPLPEFGIGKLMTAADHADFVGVKIHRAMQKAKRRERDEHSRKYTAHPNNRRRDCSTGELFDVPGHRSPWKLHLATKLWKRGSGRKVSHFGSTSRKFRWTSRISKARFQGKHGLIRLLQTYLDQRLCIRRHEALRCLCMQYAQDLFRLLQASAFGKNVTLLARALCCCCR